MPPPQVTAKKPRLRLRTDGWFAECERAELRTDGQRAVAFLASRQAVNEIQSGKREPSGRFIAGVMAFFAPRRVRFEDLFEWVAA